jgi:hypothetical protein
VLLEQERLLREEKDQENGSSTMETVISIESLNDIIHEFLMGTNSYFYKCVASRIQDRIAELRGKYNLETAEIKIRLR